MKRVKEKNNSRTQEVGVDNKPSGVFLQQSGQSSHLATDNASKTPADSELASASYQKLFESVPGLNLILSPDFRIIAVTNSYLAATMTEREGIMGKGIFEVFPDNPNDPNATGVSNLRHSLETTLTTKKPHTMAVQRYDIRRPGDDGKFEVRYWSPINTPVLDDKGAVEFIIHRVEDVTDFVALKKVQGEREEAARELKDRTRQMEVELVLRAQEILKTNQLLAEREHVSEQLQSLVEAMPDGVLVSDEEGRIVLVNATSESMFGYCRGELLGEHVRTVLLDIDSSLKEEILIRDGQCLTGSASETTVWLFGRRRDGSEFPIHVAHGRLERKEGRMDILAIRDMTDLRRAEAEIHASEARYHDVLDNMFEAAQILSYDWRYLYLNDAAARNGRQRKEEMLGRTVMECFPGFDETEMYRVLKECMDEKKRIAQDFEFEYADGSVVWYAFSIQPVAEGLFILSLEITDRKMVEAETQRLNTILDQKVRERTAQLEAANRELESFSYSVSHDLRAPLRHIHGYVDMLERATRGQLSDKAQRCLSVISSASIEMSQLIDDLLSFSRMGRVEFFHNVVSLDMVVADSIRALESEITGRNISWTISPLPNVLGDPIMLKHVFVNLIGNAVKYTRRRDLAEIEIWCYAELDGQTVISIQDNGAGFDMKYADKLFGVFQRLHRNDEFEGNGIGLAIVQRIVTRHGGQMWAEAEVDRGAKFSIRLSPPTGTPALAGDGI